MTNVLYIPKIKVNLFSSGCALDKGLTMKSNNEKCEFFQGDYPVAVGVRKNKLFQMKFKTNVKNDNINANITVAKYSLKFWHECLAHQNVAQVRSFLNKNNIEFDDNKQFFCEKCPLGKMHKLPFQSSSSVTNFTGEIIHVDLCGPMQKQSLGGARYFLMFKDGYSHYRKVFFIREKTMVVDHLSEYIKSVESDTGNKVKCIRSDNGLEFVNKDFEKVLKNGGI